MTFIGLTFGVPVSLLFHAGSKAIFSIRIAILSCNTDGIILRRWRRPVAISTPLGRSLTPYIGLPTANGMLMEGRKTSGARMRILRCRQITKAPASRSLRFGGHPTAPGMSYPQGGPVQQYGTAGDIPVPGDYTGAGMTQLATWDPTTFVWNVNGVGQTSWGTTDDVPLPLPYAIRQYMGYTH